MNELFNFNYFSRAERDSMDLHKVDFSKYLSQLSDKSRRDSKPSHCFYCREKNNRFCNSHSVPASFLKNIAVDGKVFTTNVIIDLPILETEKGVNSSGTFQIICRKCDSEIFREYENASNYENMPTDKMLAQIAMKNHLRNIGKRLFEKSLYEHAIAELGNRLGKQYANMYFKEMLNVSKIDLLDYIRDFKKAKKAIEKEWENEYYLFFYERLEYVVPIAFQGEVCLNFDFNGNTINDVYNKSKHYNLQSLHIAIFPMKSYSIVMLFISKNSNRLRQFYKRFNSLEPSDKLSVVNYIILSYSEDVFMSKSIHDRLVNDEELKRIVGLTTIHFADSPIKNNDHLEHHFNLSDRHKTPNFLLMHHDNV
ncbi:hypothetical protein [Geomonas paludis]|uniref:Uncharacterized protein n=1 Tax=Geomonas paludis TaxID=2740185 RepID=A0A6V8MWL5_9BACT|nr:hypothetical protein [Geomonas paludis]GFO63963.1 hypothetical protein GMPD_18820 [Geomonas paludis]